MGAALARASRRPAGGCLAGRLLQALRQLALTATPVSGRACILLALDGPVDRQAVDQLVSQEYELASRRLTAGAVDTRRVRP